MYAWSGQILFLNTSAKSQIHLKQAAINLQACHCTQEMHALAVSCRETPVNKRDLILSWPHPGFVSWTEDPRCSFLCYLKTLVAVLSVEKCACHSAT